jgi:hypothetical protein
MANSERTAGVRQLFAIRTAGAITGLAQSSHGQQRQYIERVVWVVGVEYDYVGCSWKQDDVVAVRHAVLVAVGHFDDKWQITLYRCLDLTSRHNKPIISNTCRVNSLVGELPANQFNESEPRITRFTPASA